MAYLAVVDFHQQLESLSTECYVGKRRLPLVAGNCSTWRDWPAARLPGATNAPPPSEPSLAKTCKSSASERATAAKNKEACGVEKIRTR